MTLLLLAGAVVVWPGGQAARRLRGLWPRARWVPRVSTPPPAVLVVVVSGVVGWVLLGPGGAVAFGLVGAVVWRRQQKARTLRESLAARDGLAEAVAAFVAELSVGTHPVDAAERVAVDAEPDAAAVLRTAAATTRLGGDTAMATGGPLTHAWRLAVRHGLPLADVLASVSGDLRHRSRFTRQVLARTAGARSSATALAAMPVPAVLFGESMGARPWHTLAHTAAGQALLIVGSALICAGLVWTDHLTHQAVTR